MKSDQCGYWKTTINDSVQNISCYYRKFLFMKNILLSVFTHASVQYLRRYLYACKICKNYYSFFIFTSICLSCINAIHGNEWGLAEQYEVELDQCDGVILHYDGKKWNHHYHGHNQFLQIFMDLPIMTFSLFAITV